MHLLLAVIFDLLIGWAVFSSNKRFYDKWHRRWASLFSPFSLFRPFSPFAGRLNLVVFFVEKQRILKLPFVWPLNEERLKNHHRGLAFRLSWKLFISHYFIGNQLLCCKTKFAKFRFTRVCLDKNVLKILLLKKVKIHSFTCLHFGRSFVSQKTRKYFARSFTKKSKKNIYIDIYYTNGDNRWRKNGKHSLFSQR